MTARSTRTATAGLWCWPPQAVFIASQRMRRGKVPGKDAGAVRTTQLCSRSQAIELHAIAGGIDYVWLAGSGSISWLSGLVACRHL